MSKLVLLLLLSEGCHTCFGQARYTYFIYTCARHAVVSEVRKNLKNFCKVTTFQQNCQKIQKILNISYEFMHICKFLHVEKVNIRCAPL